ncbi:MAG: T9SS type A sorting domain-containing protein [Chitinophagales bacterium]|nr:T9SS type A sorting domain-containing protein [Chitinophagales bacterium]
MKKLLFFTLLFSCLQLYSQHQSDVWQLGASLPGTEPSITFVNGFPETYLEARSLKMFVTNASIADTNGQLLFYSNGQWIANRSHDTLKSSENFNPGYATDVYYDYGLGIPEGMVILPKPEHSNVYSLFYVTFELITIDGVFDYQPLHLSYSEIDMEQDSGLGSMVLKNQFLIEDTLIEGFLVATKHANGRDWWVFSHEYQNSNFYSWLLTQDSIYGHYSQTIGVDINYDAIGQAKFSPDGSKYAIVNMYQNTVQLFDFDRCTGLLSNALVDSNFTDLDWLRGCSFSPNNRFLYVNNASELFQYDTWVADIISSRIKIADWDSSYNPLATWFEFNQMGPDNKIYINTVNGAKVMHVINQPDSLGTACDFVQGGLELPDDSYNIPNFPNYDLGALPGSPCDTVYTTNDTHILDHVFRIYPNPASEWLNIVYNIKDDALFELFDLYGRRVAAVSLYQYFKNRTLNVHGLSEGVYAYTIKNMDGILKTGKLVVVK